MDIKLRKTYLPGFHYSDAVKKMFYNPLGKTGLLVSKLSLGTSQLALLYGTDKEQEGIDTVIEAVKNGINYMDTAPFYGEGKSEIVLGKALQKIPRETYYIGTKVGRYTNNVPTMFDFSADRVTRSVTESLSRLGLSYVDIIQVHDIEFAPSMDILVKETLPALQKIKESGLAKFIGITGYPLDKLKELLELSPVEIDVVLSYCRYTLFDTALYDYVAFFKSKNVGIINAAGLGMNLLTNSGPPSWHPVKPVLKEACKKATEFCEKNGVDIARLATEFTLAAANVDTHLIGMPRQEVLKKNLDVLHNRLTGREYDLLVEVRTRYFDNLKERNWENVELEKYWKTMAESKIEAK